MTQRTLRKFEVLSASIVRNSPRVQRQLSGKNGNKADSPVVESAAKYNMALKKLALK